MGDKAETYLAQGELDAADQILRKAEPQHIDEMAGEYVNFLLYRRQFDAALAFASRTIQAAPQRPDLSVAEDHIWLGSLQILAGHSAEGQALLEQARKTLMTIQNGGDTNLRLFDSILISSAALGDHTEVERQAAALRSATGRDLWRAPESEEVIAVSYAILGDADRAVPLLERCLSAFYRRSVTPALLRLDPAWDKIRADPHFQELVKRTNEASKARCAVSPNEGSRRHCAAPRGCPRRQSDLSPVANRGA
ncbi:MAG: hypothetical protein ABI217_08195 [Chthoniobacterales bacterium]